MTRRATVTAAPRHRGPITLDRIRDQLTVIFCLTSAAIIIALVIVTASMQPTTGVTQ